MFNMHNQTCDYFQFLNMCLHIWMDQEVEICYLQMWTSTISSLVPWGHESIV